jgi:hypothetical protein
MGFDLRDIGKLELNESFSQLVLRIRVGKDEFDALVTRPLHAGERLLPRLYDAP